ncbi:MAG: hypothetical protein IJ773_14560 [Lachnospiraceae bacterium]|nr:hypothetical protein [Lachnospiraceae bacterium]
MALFYNDKDERYDEGQRAGFPRYRRVLEGNIWDFMKTGFATLLFHIPYTLLMAYAILSTSSLMALVAGLVGGALAGPGLAALYDLILRRLRDDKGDWWECFKRSLRQNTRASLLPGAVTYGFWSVVIFGAAIALWQQVPVTPGTLVLTVFAALLFTMVVSVWWPQVVLFEQTPLLQIKNAVFFAIFHFWRVLGVSAIQLVFWGLMFFFLPWTGFLIPVLGIWYILFLSMFLLYRQMDDAFRIEEQIEANFPGRMER